MTSPAISVLIPLYNAENFIAQAIESVLNQTFTNFEIIIVDNCSTDSSFEIASKYTTDSRVKLFRNPENIGMVRNWNQCILHANGEYLKFLFADDYFKENALSELIAPFLKDHSINLVVSPRVYLFDDGSTIEHPIYFKGKKKGNDVIDECISKNLNPLGEPSFIMIRKKDATLGLFNPDMFWLADIDYWLRLSSNGHVYSVEAPCIFYRKHSAQVTESIITKGKFLQEERDFIYYNFFIRKSNKQNQHSSYYKAIWSNIRYNLSRTKYKDQKDYMMIWPVFKGLMYRFYLWLYNIYKTIRR